MGRQSTSGERRLSPILVALLVSLLLHQLFLTAAGEIWPDTQLEPDEPTEVMLVETPPAEPPEPPVEEPPPPPLQQPPPVSRPKLAHKTPTPQPVVPQSPPPGPEEPTAIAAPTAPEPHTHAHPEPPAPGEVNLDLDWKSFERAFGEESVEEREAYAEASLEKRRGAGSFGAMTAKVRKALRTNKGWIQPGNQEPLGNRQQIFHRYIAMVHKQDIHPLFAESFWESLPSLGTSHPLNDWSLHTVAEFEIFESGQISEIRVVKTSGNMVFDAAAVDAVYRSSPFPRPPREVLSWNDRVYLRWGFYRNRRMCGVFNVEPYILKAPGAKKEEVDIDDYIKTDG